MLELLFMSFRVGPLSPSVEPDPWQDQFRPGSIDFLLNFGIAGFRIDAASRMVDHPLVEVGAEAQPPDVLREFYDRST
jgi:glycosidase